MFHGNMYSLDLFLALFKLICINQFYKFCDVFLIPVLRIMLYLSSGPAQTKSQETKKNVQGMGTLWKELNFAKHEISQKKLH